MSLPPPPSRVRRPSSRFGGAPVPSEEQVLEQLMRSLDALRRANAALRAMSYRV